MSACDGFTIRTATRLVRPNGALQVAAPAEVSADRRGDLDLLDASAMLSSSGFPIEPAELISRTQAFIADRYGALEGVTDVLAPEVMGCDFAFRALPHLMFY